MEYRKFDQTFIVRIDRGEEIVSCVQALAEKEKIHLASVQALGAVGAFTVGTYSVEEKTYYSQEFSGEYEIVSLTGTINTMDDQIYCHLHMSAADRSCQVVGGHLNRAVVSATCEMVVTAYDGRVDREKDPVTGLNLYRFLEIE
jgi:predicted DNA-binding protein with PD1-like motif